jgi:hypothetical protein
VKENSEKNTSLIANEPADVQAFESFSLYARANYYLKLAIKLINVCVRMWLRIRYAFKL